MHSLPSLHRRKAFSPLAHDGSCFYFYSQSHVATVGSNKATYWTRANVANPLWRPLRLIFGKIIDHLISSRTEILETLFNNKNGAVAASVTAQNPMPPAPSAPAKQIAQRAFGERAALQ